MLTIATITVSIKLFDTIPTAKGGILAITFSTFIVGNPLSFGTKRLDTNKAIKIHIGINDRKCSNLLGNVTFFERTNGIIRGNHVTIAQPIRIG